jgi:hypothetical protein
MAPAFHPRQLRDHWTGVYRDVAEDYVARLPRGEVIDLFSTLAAPFAARVLANLLGIESATDAQMIHWSQSLIDAAGNFGWDPEPFAIVDAAMNDLVRPSLYRAWHDIIPVEQRAGEPRTYDVVGPVCETGDFLGKERQLVLVAGDLLAVRTAGAYGFTMASNYNTRPRPAEIMVDGSDIHCIREREQISDLWRGEHLLP